MISVCFLLPLPHLFIVILYNNSHVDIKTSCPLSASWLFSYPLCCTCAIPVLYLVLSPCSQPLLLLPLKHCLSMYVYWPSCTLRLSGIRFPLGCNLFANTLFESTCLKTLYFSHRAYIIDEWNVATNNLTMARASGM